MSKIEMTGRKCGRLLVLEESPRPDSVSGREIYWKCQCDCGNIAIVRGTQLRNGKTQSCGCLQKEKTTDLRKKDITNKRFGHLIALFPNGLDTNKHYLWHCKCDCGGECDINVSNLTGGLIKSCGCLWHNSIEIENIKQLLTDADIPYITEYKVNIGTRNFYFDIYVNNQYIIEYDGEQHFKFKTTGWNNEDNFLKTRERDLIKNKYCFENNIPLIRIPYKTKYTLEDLKIKTTHFLLTNVNEKEYYGMGGDND